MLETPEVEGGCRQVALATGGEKWGEMRGLREVRGLEHDYSACWRFLFGFWLVGFFSVCPVSYDLFVLTRETINKKD